MGIAKAVSSEELGDVKATVALWLEAVIFTLRINRQDLEQSLAHIDPNIDERSSALREDCPQRRQNMRLVIDVSGKSVGIVAAKPKTPAPELERSPQLIPHPGSLVPNPLKQPHETVQFHQFRHM